MDNHPATAKTGKQPIDLALFARTAPAFNCIAHPGRGMHYLGAKGCLWCGMTRDQIAAEQPETEQPPACRWVVNGRNGYWPIDEIHGDSVHSVMVLTRLSEAQAEQIAGALNHAYYLGTQHATTEGTTKP